MATTTIRKHLQGEEARKMAREMKEDKENQKKRDAEKNESVKGLNNTRS